MLEQAYANFRTPNKPSIGVLCNKSSLFSVRLNLGLGIGYWMKVAKKDINPEECMSALIKVMENATLFLVLLRRSLAGLICRNGNSKKNCRFKFYAVSWRCPFFRNPCGF